MRSTRLRKYRRQYRVFLIGIQLLALWCLLIVTATSLTSYTNAAFNDIEQVRASLEVGWEDGWDKSSLEFTGQGTDSEDPTKIFATIKNGADSEPMDGTVVFEVFFIENGNPKNGEIVFTGTVPALESGQETTLYYTPEQTGKYMFKAYQRDGHPGTGVLWSEAVSFEVINTLSKDDESQEAEDKSTEAVNDEEIGDTDVQKQKNEEGQNEESSSESDVNKEQSSDSDKSYENNQESPTEQENEEKKGNGDGRQDGMDSKEEEDTVTPSDDESNATSVEESKKQTGGNDTGTEGEASENSSNEGEEQNEESAENNG